MDLFPKGTLVRYTGDTWFEKGTVLRIILVDGEHQRMPYRCEDVHDKETPLWVETEDVQLLANQD